MDMKAKGIANDTLRRALAQAKEGRLHILGKMREVISAPADHSVTLCSEHYNNDNSC